MTYIVHTQRVKKILNIHYDDIFKNFIFTKISLYISF